MSSFIWMKLLESAPERYDHGIRLLSRGRMDDVYEHVAGWVAAPGRKVLDIGCGTGGLSLACATRGAHVTGIDVDPGMLEVARAKPVPGAGTVELIELGVAEVEGRFAERRIELVEARCTGASDCVQVCPCDVLAMQGARRKVAVVRPEPCIQCGACVVQCPEDALRFRYEDGRVVEAPTIRQTRMNLVGRRTATVRGRV